MLCESCGKNPAAIRVKTIINGELTDYSLCASCAQKLGYAGLLTGFGRGAGSFLTGFQTESAVHEEPLRCSCCGSAFDDIARSGKVGCAECYHTFANQLQQIVQRIYGNAKHRGKVPGGELLPLIPKNQLSVMRSELREAIDSENYEHAAELRDRIRLLEGDARHE